MSRYDEPWGPHWEIPVAGDARRRRNEFADAQIAHEAQQPGRDELDEER